MSLGEIVEEHDKEISALRINMQKMGLSLLKLQNQLIEYDIKPKFREKISKFIHDKKKTLKYLITVIISGGSLAKIILYMVENDLILDFVMQFFTLSILIAQNIH